MKKPRAVLAQRHHIKDLRAISRDIADILIKGKKLAPHLRLAFQCPGEVEARANPYGSRFYQKIYPTRPLTKAEIQNEFSNQKTK